jgi:VIT1/CCC1 family predicted Fe2+/Mn2+ transporter
LSAWGLLVSLVGAGVALALVGAIVGRAAPAPVRVRRTRKTRR